MNTVPSTTRAPKSQLTAEDAVRLSALIRATVDAEATLIRATGGETGEFYRALDARDAAYKATTRMILDLTEVTS